MRRQALVIAASILLLGTAAAEAHRPGPPPPRPTRNAFQLRLGYFVPQDGGSWWDATEDRFTLRVSDFDGFAWGASFVGGLSRNVEVGVHADWYQRTVSSAERDYVEAGGYPIVHDTTLRQVPLAVDLRLVPGGRLPGRPVVYFGGGIGANFWDYVETGDFVDTGDPLLPIYFGAFGDSGIAFEARALAGIEFPVSPGFNLLFEGRFSWVEDGAPQIPRGGVWAMAGASFRF